VSCLGEEMRGYGVVNLIGRACIKRVREIYEQVTGSRSNIE